MSGPDVITTSDLWFTYDGEPVLRGVSCAIAAGEFLGVIGPNGSGKTTLLKLLTRVLRPDRGVLRLGGEDYRRISARAMARRIGVVPQESPVIFPFTVAEIVLMGRAPHLGAFAFEGERDIEIARRAMEQTDVLHLADRRIGELSGGEKQRVIVARALAQEPEILLLDEPTSSLDIHHQIEVYERLEELNRTRGLTVVVVSHDLNMAAQYCRRLLLLRKGEVYRSGPPLEVITQQSIREVYGAEVVIEQRGQPPTPFVLPCRRGADRPGTAEDGR